MSNLQNLNIYLTQRLTLAAHEIFKAVEDVFLKYNEELCRSRKEIAVLKRRLQLAAQLESETQISVPESRGQNCSQSCEEWKDTEMQMKLDVYTQHEEENACTASASLSQCSDDRPNYSDNIYSLVNLNVKIKDESEAEIETNSSCQSFEDNLTHNCSCNQPSDANKINSSHIDFHSHEKTCQSPSMNQETLRQHVTDLVQIRERLMDEEEKKTTSKARTQRNKQKVCRNPELYKECRKKERKRIFLKIQHHDFQHKSVNAIYSQTWRNKLKCDPVKYAQYRALENARHRQNRRKKAEAKAAAAAVYAPVEMN